MPPHALPGLEALLQALFVCPHRSHLLQGRCQVNGAALVSEHQSVLGRQLIGSVVRSEFDVATGRLVVEPLTDITLMGPRALGQLRRRQPSGAAHRPVQTQTMPDVGKCTGDRGAEVADDPSDELLDLLLVDGHSRSPARDPMPPSSSRRLSVMFHARVTRRRGACGLGRRRARRSACPLGGRGRILRASLRAAGLGWGGGDFLRRSRTRSAMSGHRHPFVRRAGSMLVGHTSLPSAPLSGCSAASARRCASTAPSSWRAAPSRSR